MKVVLVILMFIGLIACGGQTVGVSDDNTQENDDDVTTQPSDQNEGLSDNEESSDDTDGTAEPEPSEPEPSEPESSEPEPTEPDTPDTNTNEGEAEEPVTPVTDGAKILPNHFFAMDFSSSNLDLPINDECKEMPVQSEKIEINSPLAGNCALGPLSESDWLEYTLWSDQEMQYDIGFAIRANSRNPVQVRFLLNEKEIGTSSYTGGFFRNFLRYDLQDITIPAGESTLKIISGGNIDALSEIRIVEDIRQEIILDGISLLDAKTEEPIAGFENLPPGSDLIVNLDALESDEILLSASTSFLTEQVAYLHYSVIDEDFSQLDTSTSTLATANDIPFINTAIVDGKFTPWKISEGYYSMRITPYRLTNRDAFEFPKTATYNLAILKSNLKVIDTSIDMITGEGNIANGILKISNEGTAVGEFKISSAPSWLEVDTSSGVIQRNRSVEIALNTKEVCESETVITEDTLTVEFNGNRQEDVLLRHVCNSSTSFDLALDRVIISQGVTAIDTGATLPNDLPIIMNKPGIMRAFVTGTEESGDLPKVSLHYKHINGETGKLNFLPVEMISTSAREDNLETTYNLHFDETLIQFGTEFYIQIDDEQLITQANTTNDRWPKVGFFVPRIIPTLEIDTVFVPIIANGIETTMTDQEAKEYMEYALAHYPMAKFKTEVHPAIEVDSLDVYDIADIVGALQQMDDKNRYYHALLDEALEVPTSIGEYQGKLAVSTKEKSVVAHEFGHNLSLGHTECGTSAKNPDYPHPNSEIGEWNYNPLSQSLVPPTTKDFMSYCDPSWTSRYSYSVIGQYWQSITGGFSFFDFTRANQKIRTIEEYHSVLPSNSIVTKSQVKKPSVWLVATQDTSTKKTNLEYVFTSSNDTAVKAGAYTLQGFDKHGKLIFAQAMNTQKFEHSEQLRLSAPLMDEPIASIRIIHQNDILFEKTLPQGDLNLDRVVSAISAKRVKGNLIEISWPADSYSSLLVKNDEGKVVGFGQKSPLKIHSNDNSFSFTVTTLRGSEKRDFWVE